MAKTNRKPNGSSVSSETSIYQTLKGMINTDTKVYYVMWKFCPEYLKDNEADPIFEKPLCSIQ